MSRFDEMVAARVTMTASPTPIPTPVPTPVPTPLAPTPPPPTPAPIDWNSGDTTRQELSVMERKLPRSKAKKTKITRRATKSPTTFLQSWTLGTRPPARAHAGYEHGASYYNYQQAPDSGASAPANRDGDAHAALTFFKKQVNLRSADHGFGLNEIGDEGGDQVTDFSGYDKMDR